MKKFTIFGLVLGSVVLAPGVVRACACGCGIFDVGTSSMLPTDLSRMLFVNYSFQDQNQNWSNTGPAPAANNPDQEIRTHFVTLGYQQMFSRQWGLEVEVPYAQRFFKTTGGSTGSQVVGLNWSGFGDVRIEGLYTGLSSDMGSGLTFGVKLPTGSFTHEDAYSDIDRDTELGTGSTDIILGGFHRHRLTADNAWTWFGQSQFSVPVLTQDRYRPGVELNAALGVYYKGWMFHELQITPLAQVIAAVRSSDSGDYSSGGLDSDPGSGRQSGYQRVLLSPGVEFLFHGVSLYSDVELPVFQDMVGNQLVSAWMLKVYLTYHF